MRTGDGCSGNEVLSVLLTEEERKDDSKKESKWKLPGEEEILRKMQSSESDMSAHLQKNFNPNKHRHASDIGWFEDKLFLNECLRFVGDKSYVYHPSVCLLDKVCVCVCVCVCLCVCVCVCEILRKMQSSESDMSIHLQKNFNPNKHMGPSPSNDTPLI